MQFKYLNRKNYDKVLGRLADRAEELQESFQDEELEELLRLELLEMQSKCELLNTMYTEIANYNLQQSIELGLEEFDDEEES